MAEIRSFTIDGTEASRDNYNITVPIKAGSTLLLVNARVDLDYGDSLTEPLYGAQIKSINLLIGNTVTNYYVVDNNDKLNALKHKIKYNMQDIPYTVGPDVSHWINISDYEPNVAYKIGSDMNALVSISIRDDQGRPLGSVAGHPTLSFFHFQFQVL